MHQKLEEPPWNLPNLPEPQDVLGEPTKPQKYVSDLEEALGTIRAVLSEQREASIALLRLISGAKTGLVINASERLHASLQPNVMKPAWDHLDKLTKVLPAYIEAEDF